eukprot:357031-Chlamydomonas_euryale.AAC.9
MAPAAAVAAPTLPASARPSDTDTYAILPRSHRLRIAGALGWMRPRGRPRWRCATEGRTVWTSVDLAHGPCFCFRRPLPGPDLRNLTACEQAQVHRCKLAGQRTGRRCAGGSAARCARLRRDVGIGWAFCSTACPRSRESSLASQRKGTFDGSRPARLAFLHLLPPLLCTLSHNWGSAKTKVAAMAVYLHNCNRVPGEGSRGGL